MKNATMCVLLLLSASFFAGCLDIFTEPTKHELKDTSTIIDEGQYYSIGPVDGYEQYEWELTYTPQEGESSDFVWNVYMMTKVNYEQYLDGHSFVYFVDLSWESMDSSGSKGPIYLEPSEEYHLVVDNSRADNDNGDSLRFRIQFFGWK